MPTPTPQGSLGFDPAWGDEERYAWVKGMLDSGNASQLSVPVKQWYLNYLKAGNDNSWNDTATEWMNDTVLPAVDINDWLDERGKGNGLDIGPEFDFTTPSWVPLVGGQDMTLNVINTAGELTGIADVLGGAENMVESGAKIGDNRNTDWKQFASGALQLPAFGLAGSTGGSLVTKPLTLLARGGNLALKGAGATVKVTDQILSNVDTVVKNTPDALDDAAETAAKAQRIREAAMNGEKAAVKEAKELAQKVAVQNKKYMLESNKVKNMDRALYNPKKIVVAATTSKPVRSVREVTAKFKADVDPDVGKLTRKAVPYQLGTGAVGMALAMKAAQAQAAEATNKYGEDIMNASGRFMQPGVAGSFGTAAAASEDSGSGDKPGKPGDDPGNQGGGGSASKGKRRKTPAASVPSTTLPVVAAATTSKPKKAKFITPSAAKVATSRYSAGLAAQAAATRANQYAIRDQANTAAMRAQGMAGDVIGGRAPAIQGQALTGVRRSQIGATSQEVQDNAAKQAALGSTYNEALNLAYENAAGSSRQKAADRSKMMATIRGTGA